MGGTADSASTIKPEFNKFQSIFWPIHGYELKKFLPMSFLMFCILFVYTMVRDLKDLFIQKYAICGSAALIPPLKLFFVMPAAFLIVILFTYLINKFGVDKTFYIIVSMFIGFYTIFVLFLFPNAINGTLHADYNKVRHLQDTMPGFLYYIIPCVTNWAYTLFYIFSEIWGTMAISSLFWQFANQVTQKGEVKRFFGLYTLIGNIGVIFSGSFLYSMSHAKGAAFVTNVRILICSCIFFAFATMALYYYINSVVLKDPKCYDPTQVKKSKKKTKMGALDGIKFLFTSPYFMLICVLVLAYGIGINFAEVVWKEQMRITLTDPDQYSAMMATLSMVTGILTIFFTFTGSNILRRFSWKISALITPLVFLVMGGAFFAIMGYLHIGGTMLFGFSLPMLAVWVGLFIDATSKSIKYCLFDQTKSMAYIPLDEDVRVKGQAAVEVIGGRAGKAGASAIFYILTNLVSAGSGIMQHLFTIIPLFIITLISWIASVFGLSKKYEAKIAEKAAESNN